MLIASTDPLGHTTRYYYDSALNLTDVWDANDGDTTMSYDARGNLLTRTAPAPLNYTESWTYDSSNNVLSYTNPRGKFTFFSYTDGSGGVPAGLLQTQTDPLGHVTSYTYTDGSEAASGGGTVPAGLRKTMVDPRGNADGGTPTAHTTSYGYDRFGDLASGTTPMGETTTYGYDSARHRTSTTEPRGNVAGCGCAAQYTTASTYDPAGNVTAVTDALGHVTSFGYDDAGNRIWTRDALGRQTDDGFDAANRPVTVTGPPNPTVRPVTTTTYDDDGNVGSVVTPTGAKTTYTYDLADRQLTMTRPNGNVAGASQALHDSYTSTFGYDAVGNQTSVSLPDPNGGAALVTTTRFDALNRPTGATDPTGATTTTGYDEDGNTVAATDSAGNTSFTRYDDADRPWRLTDPLGRVSSITYDEANNQASVTDRAGGLRTFTYDNDNRLATSVDPRGNVTGCGCAAQFTITYGYDAAGQPTTVTDPLAHTTTTAYDRVGKRSRVTDANNHTTSYGYDGLNRLSAVTAPDANPPTNGGLTSYGYDAVGNLSTRTDANNHTSSATFDGDHRLVAMTSPLGQQWSYGYDADGNRLQVVTAIGNATPVGGDGTITSTYDTLNRLVATDYSDATPDVQFTYDRGGRRASMADGAGTPTYSYDTAGRLSGISRGSTSWLYGYDADGNVTSRTYPDGTAVAQTYDNEQRLTGVTSTPPGGGSGPAATYGYDAAGNLTAKTLPAANGYVESRSYDNAGRLLQVSNAKGASILSRFALTLDPVGNPLVVATTRGGTTSSEAYLYDNADRLVKDCIAVSSCTGAPQTNTYTYDPVGNRLSLAKVGGANPATTTYGYNAADQLTQTISGTTTANYTYDADGNETRAGVRTLGYDLADRLTSTTSGTTTDAYSYDGDGNRRTASVNGTVSDRYSWDLNNRLPQLAREDQGNGTLLRRYISGLSTVSLTTPAGNFYYHYDNLGSVTELTDAAGSKQWKYIYDPYGAQSATTQQVSPTAPANPVSFGGQYLDGDTSLYYLRTRQYDTKTGRFTATDPYQVPVGQPFVSTYAYVFDRPTIFVDPAGEWPHPPRWLSTALSLGVAATPAAIVSPEGLHLATHPWEVVTVPAAGAGQAYYGAGGGLDGTLLAIDAINPAARIRDTYRQGVDACYAGNRGECVRDLLSGTVQSALLACPALAGRGATVLEAAEESSGLIRLSTRESWANPRTLDDHFARHGADFGASSADDYARQASEFFQRGGAERLPTKIGPDGTIRIYDPASNSFGSFGPGGLTKTYFKPTRSNYWQNQPGVVQ